MKKRIFALLLAFIMLVGMLPVQAFAAATEVTVTDNVARIDYSKCKNCGICASVCPRKIIHPAPQK